LWGFERRIAWAKYRSVHNIDGNHMTQGPNQGLAATDDDSDDVRWALQVAVAKIKQGEQAEAISWVKRAAKAANDSGQVGRGNELSEHARQMAQTMWNLGSQAPPPRQPMPTSVEIEIEADSSPSDRPAKPPPLPKRRLAPPPGARRRPTGAPPPLPNRAGTTKSIPPGKRPSQLILTSSIPPAPDPPGFEQPSPERKSLTQIDEERRRPLASAPELEIEEMSSDELEAVGIKLEMRNPPSAPPSSEFNDRLSSADVERESVESVIPSLGDVQLDSVPPSEAPPAPDSVRRALALISEEEILEEEEDERVTQDLGFVHGSNPPTRTVGQPQASERDEQVPSSRRGRASDLGELTLEVSDLGPPSEAEVPGPAPTPAAVPQVGNVVDGIALDQVRGFEDLPEEVQEKLAQIARIEALDADEEVAFFGAAVVTAGTVDILPAFSDDSGAVAHQADVVFTKGTLPEAIALRVVSKVDGTRVAVWEPEPFDEAIAECPWVHDELRFIADYFLAVCGAALGPLGERLDDSLRGTVFNRLEVKALQPGEVLMNKDEAIPSLFVLGGGRLEAVGDAGQVTEFPAGSFVFANQMISAQKAPAAVRAGSQGALVLFAPRSTAHELMMSVPPLLEVMSS
jgi:hypothetical protein